MKPKRKWLNLCFACGSASFKTERGHTVCINCGVCLPEQRDRDIMNLDVRSAPNPRFEGHRVFYEGMDEKTAKHYAPLERDIYGVPIGTYIGHPRRIRRK